MFRPNSLIVASSWMFIWMPPSPAMTHTGSSGWAKATPIAAGSAKPIVPRPPLVMWLLALVNSKNWAAHIWCCPTSVTSRRSGPAAAFMASITCIGPYSSRADSLRRLSGSWLLASSSRHCSHPSPPSGALSRCPRIERIAAFASAAIPTVGFMTLPSVGIAADAKAAMRSILGHLDNAPDGGEGCGQWREELTKCQEPERRRKESARDEYGPIQVMEAIKAAAGPDLRLVTDVGQHQMWAAQFFEFTKANSHITSGGLGTMGFALPAAMGVAFAYPEDPVWVIAGDGGIQMNIQELATIRDFGLNIKVAVLNNGYLGMVRQWQQFFHNRRYSETPITGPDYEQLTAAYGLAGRTVSEGDDVEAAVRWAQEQEGCTILDFHIDPEANVYPMIPSGMSVNEMIEEDGA